ncbi:SDR family oxidoreductase [Micromonospora sp. NPDC049114]|uniref:SDR family oxidoreductase n=1 Tax=unclassified Micromonospora TaxID=2617518 RepID=UPI001F3B73AA|nr:SDR family oxidoreductase [Micromonospora sp. MH99]MCF0096588.1 putative oxidoreductase [Micromonospora sp. MH99]
MKIAASTALVTGANRGFGRHLAAELVARGATVYAAARNPDSVDLPGVTPVRLDITDPDSVAAAATLAGDVNLLVNNAGIDSRADLLEGDLDQIRLELETHYLGNLSMIRSFAPVIAGNGGGTVLNVLSVLSWVNFPLHGAYGAAKSAEWAMTNALRLQLAERGVRVAGLHVGYMDTEMAATITGAKSDPAVIARLAVDGIEADAYEIVTDDVSRQVQAGLAGGVAALYPQLP